MKKREDCFFGLHFDYHAQRNQKYVGRDLNIEELERLFKEVKPDFVQCDSKGHPGIASFKTKYGTSVKMEKDSLLEWRRISKKYGALLFAHYSGLYDCDAIGSHKEWAVVDQGFPSKEFASVFGDYTDKLMIPQLKELAGIYQLDGAWIDGDCWGAYADYSKKTTEEFKKKTGLDPNINIAEFKEPTFSQIKYKTKIYKNYL